jgi:phenylacetate-coenzyme A ligase PaaK-like adenylate-forming protein
MHAGVMTRPSAVSMIVGDRLQRVLAAHFDPVHGAPFWIERAAALGFDPRRAIRSPADLELLGNLSAAELAGHPLSDFIPRRFHRSLNDFIVGRTGGTTGDPLWTAYRRDEFDEAFIRPFAVAAAHAGFPRGERWLYVGPSGPHIIGKAAPALARSMGSMEPFSVDFDPSWARRLPDGSFARQRYLEHIVEQALAIIEREPIGVLFATPPVLHALGDRLTDDRRHRIAGVHYGGISVAPDEMKRLQLDVYPQAVHMSGYGNTLFGCCLELNAAPGRSLDFFPLGDRLLLDVVDDDGRRLPPGERGRVRFTRLDESVLLVNLLERDEAALVLPPQEAPADFSLPGVRDPAPRPADAPAMSAGLY